MEIIIVVLLAAVILIQIISVFFQNKKRAGESSEVTELLIKNINNEKEIFLQMENNLALKVKTHFLRVYRK